MSHDDTHRSLADRVPEALEPVRQAFRAQVIFGLIDTGIADRLATGPRSLPDLSRALRLRADRLAALLRYAVVEDLVETDGTCWRLTPAMSTYLAFRPWYDLLLGGYGTTLTGLSGHLAEDATGYGERDLTYVGRGSSGISQFDTIPIVRELIAELPRCRLIADLGSSDASYLVSLCAADPELRAIAVEPTAQSAALAREQITARGLADRISVVNRSVQEFVQEFVRDLSPGIDCHIMAFVLQELLAQEGREYVVDLLRELRRHRARVHLVVVEVNAAVDPEVLRTRFGRAYYNPYFLLHEFTRQRLLGRAEWLTLFREAGYTLVSSRHPSPDVDPTRIEEAFLLRSTG